MIEVKNLQRTFRVGQKDVEALRTVNQRVDEGEFFVLLGPSGSGKTVQIQDYLITVVQNIELLIARTWPKPRVALALANPQEPYCAGARGQTCGLLSAFLARFILDNLFLHANADNRNSS